MKNSKRTTILVVDDEHGVRQSFNMVLKDKYDVLIACTGEEAIDIFRKNSIDLILLDILLPDINGIDLLKKLKEMDPNTEIIMVTAVKEIQIAVKAIKMGAYEYIVKPFVVDDVLIVIDRALEKLNLLKEVAYLKNELKRHHSFEKMIGKSKKMRVVFDLISTVSQSDGTVLIQGESGTGKELVARAIHNRSSRKDQPFVVINCAAIPAPLMESEIFGYNRGAFTGATNTTMGKLEIANKGTVFFDDVDTLDIRMQAKLLRVIQEKEIERLGSTKVINVDIRFVAASKNNLNRLVSQGLFREDLFFRLNVFPINLPPLRERKSDIKLLVDHFFDFFSGKTGKAPKRFSKEATQALMRYDWPGNVRELENLIERLTTIIQKPVIHSQDISLSYIVLKNEITGLTLKDALEAFERQYIREILESAGGNRNEAAEILGIHRNTIARKIK